MALAFGGLIFKQLPDNTVEVRLDDNQTNINKQDIKELNLWLSHIQNEMHYEKLRTPQQDLYPGIPQVVGNAQAIYDAVAAERPIGYGDLQGR